MNDRIYDENGYVNIPAILNKRYPFTFIVGGRATGKTYGALQEAVRSGRRFILLRRTQSQVDLICKSEFSPFKTLNKHNDWNIQPKAISRFNVGFYDGDQLIGYGAALSTFSSLRGFDSSDVDLLIYDEFIPEKHEKRIKGEGEAFANTIETIARNRELNDEKPLQVLCLANSNDLANPIFTALNLVNVVEKMRRKDKTLYTNEKTGVCIILLGNSPISEKKRETALYRLMHGTSFEQMAIYNDFSEDDTANVKPQPIIEYKPLATIKGICIYKHKSERRFYVTQHVSGSPEAYGSGNAESVRFLRDYGDTLRSAYVSNKVYFETYNDKVVFEIAVRV